MTSHLIAHLGWLGTSLPSGSVAKVDGAWRTIVLLAVVLDLFVFSLETATLLRNTKIFAMLKQGGKSWKSNVYIRLLHASRASECDPNISENSYVPSLLPRTSAWKWSEDVRRFLLVWGDHRKQVCHFKKLLYCECDYGRWVRGMNKLNMKKSLKLVNAKICKYDRKNLYNVPGVRFTRVQQTKLKYYLG